MKKQGFVTSFGLLILRLVSGASMSVTYGWAKYQDYDKLIETFPDPLGIGVKWSLICTIGAELVCAAMVAAGFFTRLAAIPLAFAMGVALFMVHGADPWQERELAALYMAIFSALIFTGGGRYSLDNLMRGRKPKDS